jgi:hypothetical protein
MHTVILQVVRQSNHDGRETVHEGHVFDAKTKAAAIASAMRAARSWWTIEGEHSEFREVQKFTRSDDVTVIRMVC